MILESCRAAQLAIFNILEDVLVAVFAEHIFTLYWAWDGLDQYHCLPLLAFKNRSYDSFAKPCFQTSSAAFCESL